VRVGSTDDKGFTMQYAVKTIGQVQPPPEDFTVIEGGEGTVVLETNEWQDDSGCHHVSKLRLCPAEARLLAAMLARHADNADA
jgi:hypothetical protein